jgi:hypothetical protein
MIRRVNFDLWPRNPHSFFALVALVVADINDRDDPDRDVLLDFFVRTAWPSERGARQ